MQITTDALRDAAHYIAERHVKREITNCGLLEGPIQHLGFHATPSVVIIMIVICRGEQASWLGVAWVKIEMMGIIKAEHCIHQLLRQGC